jgi:FkbM family methyltransferase
MPASIVAPTTARSEAAMLAGLRGLARSIRVYHLDRQRHRAMDALHGRFLGPGQLAFDLGAHVGDRVSSFRRLGARVVAVEPQPWPARVIRLLHGRDPMVTLERAAVSDQPGRLTLKVNRANPTVTTASAEFVATAEAGAAGWEGQRWDGEIEVPAITLDELIARHGRPDFVKIDVEGFEDRVLAGLGQPLPAMSFEFTTIQRGPALAAIARAAQLGAERFNVALGESQTLRFPDWVDAATVDAFVREAPHAVNSGDVYALAP